MKIKMPKVTLVLMMIFLDFCDVDGVLLMSKMMAIGNYHHLYDSSGPVEGRVSQTSLVEGAISVALLPG